jgi:hypothetical protein
MSKKLYNYTDVHQVLVAAMNAGGGSYILADHNKAKYWRIRARHYCNLLAENGNFIFTDLDFDVKEDAKAVDIFFRAPKGKLVDNEGLEIEPDKSVPTDLVPKEGTLNKPGTADMIPTSPEEEEALAFARRIKSGDIFDD